LTAEELSVVQYLFTRQLAHKSVMWRSSVVYLEAHSKTTKSGITKPC
jgi:hypothetical protein